MLSKCQETGNFRDDIFYSQITYTIHWHFHPYHYPGSSLKGTRGHFLSRTNVRSYKNLGQKALEFMQSWGCETRGINRLGNYKCLRKQNKPSTPSLTFTYVPPGFCFLARGLKTTRLPPLVRTLARDIQRCSSCLLAATGSRQQLLLPPFSSSLIESATLRLHGS